MSRAHTKVAHSILHTPVSLGKKHKTWNLNKQKIKIKKEMNFVKVSDSSTPSLVDVSEISSSDAVCIMRRKKNMLSILLMSKEKVIKLLKKNVSVPVILGRGGNPNLRKMKPQIKWSSGEDYCLDPKGSLQSITFYLTSQKIICFENSCFGVEIQFYGLWTN